MKRLTFLLILLAAIIVGLYVGYSTKLKPSSPKSSLPPLTTVLSNPLFNRVFANVGGVVIAKTKESITIEKKGKTLTLLNAEQIGLTRVQRAEKGSIEPLLSFDKLQIGDLVQAGVTVVHDVEKLKPLANSINKTLNIGDIIAHTITIIFRK